MTNIEKHKNAVNLVSVYLKYLECENIVSNKCSSHDISVSGSEKKRKLFDNNSRPPDIKVSRDFKTSDGILYMVVPPREKNSVGNISSGGIKLKLMLLLNHLTQNISRRIHKFLN